ncbi:hypothetical protein NEMBOFW57_006281 [Staphylotrichum longicolle]|uniref:Uncharacterized protein n=1 Tax=Staphylotrichum longicolle TaxID=669026 RepID=A0AAD4EYL5_9PEZI|nr:hypothetical protein NEMBOFW57_006281 [Staphylotrichum longicolle]
MATFKQNIRPPPVGVRPSESSSEDDEEYDFEPEITLHSIKTSKTIHFPIRANYTKWTPREAFRELVQNWYSGIFLIKPCWLASCLRRPALRTKLIFGRVYRRDAIIRSFNLAEQDFCVIREEKTSGRSTEIIYKVLRPGNADDTKEWLGYIRFKGREGEGGTIEITNRAATLQPWHLDLGGTSKAGDAHQAGAHGEGLKIALLVLMRGRQNHSVRCCTGGFAWKFNFTTQGRLVARLRRMSPEAIHKVEDQARRLSQRTLLPFAASPESDVQFLIGESQAGRDDLGEKTKRRPVKREDFDAWTRAALFLQEDGAIISTASGDLLVSTQLCGLIYLKGLLLCESTPFRSASITNEPLKFGYNFASGTTNRERQSVANAGEESKAILAIWSKVLVEKPDMASELSAMLNTTEPRHNLIRTAEEEECRRFTAAASVTTAALGSDFAKSVNRLLSACVRACSKTRGIDISFVQAGQLHLQLFYSEAERLFRAHERWLTVEGAIEELGLPNDLVETDVVFHAVKRLFADALEQLPRDLFVEEDKSRTEEWRRKWEVSRAEQRLLDYLRMGDLRVDTIPESLGLRLTWNVGYDASMDTMACIVRQAEDDSDQQPTSDEINLQFSTAGCRISQSNLSGGEHCEHNLEEGEEYYFVLTCGSSASIACSLIGCIPATGRRA